MPVFTFLSTTVTAINPSPVQAAETPIEGGAVDINTLYEVLIGLPDQIMGVLLAYLCFKTFLEMVK